MHILMFGHTLTGHTLEIATILIGSFLMGLWLGWLLWSKYKRFVDEIRQENVSLKGALEVTQSDLAKTKDKLIGSESEAATLHQTLETVQWEASEVKKKMNILEVDLAEQLKVNYSLSKQLSSAMALSPEAAEVETEVEVSPIDIHVESLVESDEPVVVLESQDVDEEIVIQEAEIEDTIIVDTATEPIEISIAETVVESSEEKMEEENETIGVAGSITEQIEEEEEVAADIIAEMESAEIVDESTASESLQISKTVVPPTTVDNSDVPYSRSSSRSVIVKTVRVRHEPSDEVEKASIEAPNPIEEAPIEESTSRESVEAFIEENESETNTEEEVNAWAEVVEIAGSESGDTVEEEVLEEAIVETKGVEIVEEVETILSTPIDTTALPESDDLKKIEGIGPKTAQLLAEKEIHTFATLAQTPVSRIKEILTEAGYRADPQTWPAQALLASNSEWDNLKDYQKYLVGGKRPD